ncbi:hypothetical protein KDK95_03755 [Actinospica sp. MGRD01-02]|uniref:Membrane-associated oxidoreductase n=1 Tax=Actinospica acidithermotolerans TaxID=2828514 RepID=A0A941E7L3_9ACTN|nr:hypothetical protein [Actinospica acidithermotolerans]MBR7825408.1 hypothetical protein [Actinospica acidithermotolerans]
MTEGPDWLGELSEAEERLWEAFGHGRQVEFWHGEEIRADVVAALALGAVAGTPGRTAGVRMRGARIVGELDLRHGTVEVPLTMLSCTFPDPVRLEQSVTKSIDLTGSHLVRLWATGAHIRGSLTLNRLGISDGGQDAALLQLLTVETDLLCIRLRCRGKITLINTRVGSALRLNRAELRNPGDVAINVGGMSVGSSFYFTGATIEGHLRMPGLSVGGMFSLEDSTLADPPTAGLFAHQSVSADSIEVNGNAFFDRVTAAAQIDLTGASFGGRLSFKGARLGSPMPEWPALMASSVTVARGLYIGDGFRAATGARLTGAQIGGHLDLFGMAPGSGPLQLYHAKAATVRDGRTQHGRYVAGGVGSWPADVQLDGFTYEAFDPYLDAGERVGLLRRQPGYTAQPYEFMAAYYRALGHEEAARRILIEKERVRHRDFHSLSRLGSVISSTLLGYGYLPRRAAYLAAAVQAAASIFYAYDVPTPVHPGDHVTFYPLLYAADLFVPIVHFGQADAFQSHGFAAFVAFLLPYLGWALGLAIVAGASRTLSKAPGGIV